MRGPQRKPTEHLLAANSDRGKERAKTQPKIGFAIPDPPHYLSQMALSYWPYVVSVIEPLRCTTETDAIQMGIMADALGTIAECDALIAEHGRVMPTKTGFLAQNPAISQRQVAVKQLQSALDRCGLNPAARSKVVELAPKLGEIMPINTEKRSRFADDDDDED